MEASRTDLRNPLRAPETQKIWFDGGSFRLENENADAVQIFKDWTLYLVEPLKKRYTSLDREDVARPGAQSGVSRPTVHASIAGFERLIERTARTEYVFAIGERCTDWDITLDGQKQQEICVLSTDNLAGGAEILSTMRQAGALVARVSDSPDAATRGSVLASWADLDVVDGIPLIARTFANGQPVVEIRITAIRSEPVEATAFELPAGLVRHRQRAHGGV